VSNIVKSTSQCGSTFIRRVASIQRGHTTPPSTIVIVLILPPQTLIEVNDTTIKPPPRKRRRISDTTSHEHASDTNSANLASLRAIAADAAALDAAYHPHLVQTLAKWSAKVQAVAPHVLLPSQKTTFSQRPANNLRSAPSLVDDALAGASGEKLLARTRVRRGKAGRIGTDAGAGMTTVGEGEEDEEGFDDADFYQQLLRDVIDARSGAGQDGVEKEWMVSQMARKAKKVVDTKASKGRRLRLVFPPFQKTPPPICLTDPWHDRYEVHEKLQNFMVPVPVKGQWHEEQIDELFASLLGKGFEHAIGPVDDEEVVGAQPVSLEGLRVFG
jgi:protein AATF/BFR2